MQASHDTAHSLYAPCVLCSRVAVRGTRSPLGLNPLVLDEKETSRRNVLRRLGSEMHYTAVKYKNRIWRQEEVPGFNGIHPSLLYDLW